MGEDLTPQPSLLTTFLPNYVPEKEKSLGEGPGVRCLSPLTAQLAEAAAEKIVEWVKK